MLQTDKPLKVQSKKIKRKAAFCFDLLQTQYHDIFKIQSTPSIID